MKKHKQTKVLVLHGFPDMRKLVEGPPSIFTVIVPVHGLRCLGIVHFFLFIEGTPSHVSVAPLKSANMRPPPSCSVINVTSAFC